MVISKFLLVCLSLSLVLGVAWSFDFHEKEIETEDSLWDMYERWRSHHKVAANHHEKQRRFNVFKSNVLHELVRGFQIKHQRMLKGNRIGNNPFMYANVDGVPTSVDWRKKGAVTPVKDQGQCGLMDLAFDFIKKRGGLTKEDYYPYTAADGRCDSKKENAPMVSIDGHEDVPKNNEQALMKAVAHQPVAVAIDAGGEDFQFYSEGVFTGKCGTQLDHGVAAIGYGTTLDGTKYWIVKNSWGSEWGEKGYIRMQRDKSDKRGLCGIAMEASYPIKKSADNPKSSLRDEL
ncbi:hypothetical protein L1987_47440 [Smallanthus sonchifolius]|uniref:Uncharacterized protein n=1 Tax=Smallanthus sonchifolius TaxID=185202 RepID=A0ACB9G1Y2_9ASTR|nr:hypothetical protein L1987_47440 [Smallanthus sonchifolius]